MGGEGRDSEIVPTEERLEHQMRTTGQLNGSDPLILDIDRGTNPYYSEVTVFPFLFCIRSW